MNNSLLGTTLSVSRQEDSEFQPRAAEKARALENCFPTYVFVFRQMCLFECLNTMEMPIVEGRRSPRSVDSVLDHSV